MVLLATALIAILLSTDGVVKAENLRQRTPNDNVQVDPDTSCREAYQKTPTKEACLAAKDHYERPCNYCVDRKQTMCYNADEARWAKLFGDTCESGGADEKTE